MQIIMNSILDDTMSHWQITAENGFLTPSQPTENWQAMLAHLPDTYTKITQNIGKKQSLHTILPDIKLNTNDFDTFDVSQICNSDNTASVEMLFNFFGYLASAWIGEGNHSIPESISLPLVELANCLNRPPMLSYTGMVLDNWRLKDEAEGFIPKNIELLLHFTDSIDESWFFQVHVAIEAQAGQMLRAMVDVQDAIAEEDDNTVLIHLRTMQAGLVQITNTFHEMPELCDPDVYFQQIRPYLMSFGKDIIFEGITPNPTPLRGGSGAQSSIVPAMLAGLGIGHRESELTANLTGMRHYMPLEHKEFIAQMTQSKLRDYCKAHPPLKDAYNHVLRQLITFRRAHVYYARTYIFAKSTNPVGTGGTQYMSFLSKLIDETVEQLL